MVLSAANVAWDWSCLSITIAKKAILHLAVFRNAINGFIFPKNSG